MEKSGNSNDQLEDPSKRSFLKKALKAAALLPVASVASQITACMGNCNYDCADDISEQVSAEERWSGAFVKNFNPFEYEDYRRDSADEGPRSPEFSSDFMYDRFEKSVNEFFSFDYVFPFRDFLKIDMSPGNSRFRVTMVENVDEVIRGYYLDKGGEEPHVSSHHRGDFGEFAIVIGLDGFTKTIEIQIFGDKIYLFMNDADDNMLSKIFPLNCSNDYINIAESYNENTYHRYLMTPDEKMVLMEHIDAGIEQELDGTFLYGDYSGFDNLDSLNSVVDYDSVMDFLKSFNDSPNLLHFVLNSMKGQGKPILKDISSSEQFVDLIKALPVDPHLFANILNRWGISYRDWDFSVEQGEFRNPIDILNSGWGDCDDYAVLNYFWAYINGFDPYVTLVYSDDKDSGHAFSWYLDEKNLNGYVMEIGAAIELPSGGSVGIQNHLDTYFSDCKVIFNDRPSKYV